MGKLDFFIKLFYMDSIEDFLKKKSKKSKIPKKQKRTNYCNLKEAAVEQKQAYQMFSELWLFYKKYSTTPKCAKYWQVMVKDAGEIKERYHSALCESILLDITKYFYKMEVTK